jgi:hypothetical protein
MFDLKGCSLQQAAEHGERISKFFDTVMLKAPQSLAFEKILYPVSFYRKKMYAGK